jgi:hypothetical protein
MLDSWSSIERGKKRGVSLVHYIVSSSGVRSLKQMLIYASNFFPPGLMDETIRTLALLLPTHDSSIRKWFRSQSRTHQLDPKAISCGQLKLEDRQIDHFKYWHDRLVILKQYFDDSEPRTVKQWWFDDRKRVQWFWVAVVLIVCTLFFGLVQCVEGGWQVWKAYYPSS